MNWPVKIILTKLKTREDAEYPQEDRFPSNTTIREGFMWEYSQPVVGECFFVLRGKMHFTFKTSLVQSIENIDKNTLILNTLNSVYELKIIENENT
jgi:hypothetical protein